jgi:hypothetical protein
LVELLKERHEKGEEGEKEKAIRDTHIFLSNNVVQSIRRYTRRRTKDKDECVLLIIERSRIHCKAKWTNLVNLLREDVVHGDAERERQEDTDEWGYKNL